MNRSASAKLSALLRRRAEDQDCAREHELSIGESRRLERQSWDVVPGLFRDLCSYDRPVLMEVSCTSDSLLSSAVQRLSGSESAACRCALWNAGDLRTDAGVRLIIDRLHLENPQSVWLSPPASSFSHYQNTQMKPQDQNQALHEKRQQDIRGLIGASCVFS